MRLRLTILLLAAALIGAFAAPFTVAAARPSSGGTLTGGTASGTFTDAVGGAGTFTGTFTPTGARVIDGATNVVGRLTGTLTDSLGATTAVNQVVALPITQATGSCQILDLTLGPLDLDLLGLVVHLDTVHLNITAQSGPGNLLGNLLCAVAGLLDNNNLGNALANLLNQILAILNGL